ncbi:hypothetical protein G3I46_31220 [Streptomyces coelicoflavus]|uniref:Uncharacterized protein n=1 Tax=Streptomyces coelicoflavus TaxID=285562 RepID=A0A6N9UXL6_9ACTN|nr:hypothetical protein [Streptomyces coelicoflavus]
MNEHSTSRGPKGSRCPTEGTRTARTVRAVGFFDELSPGWGFPTDGTIRDAVRPSAVADEARLVDHLRQGTRIWAEMGAQADVLDSEGPTLAGAGSLLTDGAWLWRDDLAYYVVTYHLALPEAFRAHARELGHCPPEVPEGRLVEILTRDLGVPMG